MRGSGFEIFLSGLQSVPATLQVPEVVLDEVINRYREDLLTYQTKAKEAKHISARLLPRKLSEPSLNIQELVNAYEQRLKTVIAVHGSILPYPSVPHKRIVARDLARRKPFKENGSGYRDLLIWETVRLQMLWGTERVVFVTNNPIDFGAGPLVDPDLQGEVINPRQLTLFRSLKGFNDEFILPALATFENSKAKATNEGWGDFRLAAWLQANLIDAIYDFDCLGEIVMNFPTGVGSVRAVDLGAFRKVEAHHAQRLDADRIVVKVALAAQVEFSVDIDSDDYREHSEVREFAGDDSDFIWSSTRVNHDVEINLTLIVNLTSLEVESCDVESIY